MNLSLDISQIWRMKRCSLAVVQIILLFVIIKIKPSRQQCSSQLNLTATSVIYQNYATSPNYPGNYYNNLNCEWLIDSGNPYKVVVVQFITFSLERGYDYLYIYDGGSSLRLGTWSGSQSITERSRGRYMILQFLTDHSVTRSGFRFMYYSEYGPGTSSPTPSPSTAIPSTIPYHSVCNANLQVLNSSTEYVSSPNWPYQYTNHLSCSYYFSTDSTSLSVNLTVLTLSLESYRDYVYVYDGITTDGLLLSSLTGTMSIPQTFISSGQYLTVKFTSDMSNTDTGFYMMARAVPAAIPSCIPFSLTNLTATATTNYLLSPNYPSDYDNDLDYYWLITKSDETIVLTFQVYSFNVEYQSSCNYDKLEIYYDGMKYSNEGVVTMWKSGEGKLIGSKSLKEKKMRGRTFMSKQEIKVEELVMKISQVNALSYYARVTPCGQSHVCSIIILSEKIHQSLKDIADYLNSVRCVLQKITSEDECFIGCVLTGSVKINKVMLNDLQLDNQELKIIKDLLGFDIFNRKVSRKLELWIQKCLK